MNKPKYKNLKFKTKKTFETWLNKIVKYKVHFEDKGQDFLTWWIDERGEVLHSNLQSWVWNGKMVDVDSLKKGCCLKFQDLKFQEDSYLNYKTIKVEVKK